MLKLMYCIRMYRKSYTAVELEQAVRLQQGSIQFWLASIKKLQRTTAACQTPRSASAYHNSLTLVIQKGFEEIATCLETATGCLLKFYFVEL